MIRKHNGNVKILNSLPMKGRLINNKAMVGMELKIEYYGRVYEGIKILEYIPGNENVKPKQHPKFIIEYKGVIKKPVSCNSFLSGSVSSIIEDIFIDINNKYIDDNNVVHIFITNSKNQTFEALYSGNYVDEVMKTNWSVLLNKKGKILRVLTSTYFEDKKPRFLHRVDIKDSEFVDHINNNPLDNRIENLRKSNARENTKNVKTNNKNGLVGLHKWYAGWHSSFSYNGCNIYTKINYSLEEAKIDNLIAQRHLDYKHNEDMFYLLDDISKERVQEVVEHIEEKKKHIDTKTLKIKIYNHEILNCGEYNKLILKNMEMLFDKDIDITNKRINNSYDYWYCNFVENNVKIRNRFHREVMGLRPNDKYSPYKLHVDHLNHDKSDNRLDNLVITTSYGNLCNKLGNGYVNENKKFKVIYMSNYKFWDLIGGSKNKSFLTENEAIEEVGRRRSIIDNARVKLKSVKELDDLIVYCLENGYVLENGLADLDLGYLYWRNIY